MTAIADSPDVGVSPAERLDVLFEELAELAGQRNAIDGRLVAIVAEIERDGLWGVTGCRSVAALVAWKLGTTSANAKTLTAVAERSEAFPRCVAALQEGRLSLDQVGVIASRAADGSDEHYERLASAATVSQLRTAVSLEPRPDPGPRPDREASISKTSDARFDFWRLTLPHAESATLEAALASHRDALMAEWKRDRENSDGPPDGHPPMPTTVDAFMALVETGWDVEAQRRPHGHRTTVVVHLDVEQRVGALHLGPLLAEGERQYLTCDATCEVWFERDGEVIGAGRTTRTISRRLRRALEHRDRCCAVPGWGRAGGYTRTILSIGRTAGRPSCPIWYCCVLFITAPIIGVSSPSPGRLCGCGSPTATACYYILDRWPGHPATRRRTSRPAPDRPGSAPTGGGTNPSNPSRHRSAGRTEPRQARAG